LSDLGHWEGVLEEGTDLPYGFIYKITNLTTMTRSILVKSSASLLKSALLLKGRRISAGK
tara:strand:+ start:769 stop:948 length:180 start_codon:yes stop_codon:yes gene_type:complete